MTPSFFIIGAAKAATTSLASLLAQHPDVGIVRGKEPHFFSFDKFYAAGWERYLTLYQHCKDCKIAGDASTSYSRIRYQPNTISRIRKHVPDAKIIYMVRHPVKRIESAYYEHAATPESPNFVSLTQAVKRNTMMLDSSRYWEVFSAYREAFGERNIKVVWFEEYITDVVGQTQEVCRFLGVDDNFYPNLDQEQKNTRKGSSTTQREGKQDSSLSGWDDETYNWVIEQLREDNLKLLDHFSKPKHYWNGIFL